jgi:hypothetical protein
MEIKFFHQEDERNLSTVPTNHDEDFHLLSTGVEGRRGTYPKPKAIGRSSIMDLPCNAVTEKDAFVAVWPRQPGMLLSP